MVVSWLFGLSQGLELRNKSREPQGQPGLALKAIQWTDYYICVTFWNQRLYLICAYMLLALTCT